MKKIKAGLRLLFLILVILAAAAGAGMMGVFYNRYHYQDNEIRIEMIDKKKDDESQDESKDQE